MFELLWYTRQLRSASWSMKSKSWLKKIFFVLLHTYQKNKNFDTKRQLEHLVKYSFSTYGLRNKKSVYQVKNIATNIWILYNFQIQKRILSAETIWGNTLCSFQCYHWYQIRSLFILNCFGQNRTPNVPLTDPSSKPTHNNSQNQTMKYTKIVLILQSFTGA